GPAWRSSMRRSTIRSLLLDSSRAISSPSSSRGAPAVASCPCPPLSRRRISPSKLYRAPVTPITASTRPALMPNSQWSWKRIFLSTRVHPWGIGILADRMRWLELAASDPGGALEVELVAQGEGAPAPGEVLIVPGAGSLGVVGHVIAVEQVLDPQADLADRQTVAERGIHQAVAVEVQAGGVEAAAGVVVGLQAAVQPAGPAGLPAQPEAVRRDVGAVQVGVDLAVAGGAGFTGEPGITGLQAVRVADLPASGGLDAGDLGALAAHLEYPADPLEPRTQVRVGLEIADLEVDRLAAQAQADLAVVGDHRLQVE